MKKRTRTIEEVIGYEADDGTFFSTQEECKKYEESAKYAIKTALKNIIIMEYIEAEVFQNYGYGSEEYEYWLIELKDENDLKVINQWGQYCKSNIIFVPEDIGKRFLIGVGDKYTSDSEYGIYSKSTLNSLIKGFEKDMRNIFMIKEEGEQK